MPVWRACSRSHLLKELSAHDTMNALLWSGYGSTDSESMMLLDPESLAQIYDRLQQMTQALPVAGNQDGSYLTAFSSGGLQ